jgi:predicted ester cyclase
MMMTSEDLAEIYRSYIACLNAQDWPTLGRFVGENVIHNGRALGLSGYREMLVSDFREIPDLRFAIQLLVAEPPFIASRLSFDCTPVGQFLGLAVNGRRIGFTENVFYRFSEGNIAEVWSIIDKAEIEGQLRASVGGGYSSRSGKSVPSAGT